MFFGKRQERIKHPIAHQLYNYRLGVRFDPGAQAEAFEPKFQNPLASFLGAGRVGGFVGGQWRTLQHPQVWFNRQVGINGVGGIQAGMLRGQPLMDISQLQGD